MLVDSHCHLNFSEFKQDFEQILLRAKENKVEILQTICTKIDEFDDILAISEKHPQIYCSVGIHPCEVSSDNMISFDDLLNYTKHDKVTGIGETGLDFYHQTGDCIKHQISSFITHINVARSTKLPVIIHTRDAEEKTLEILKNEMSKGTFTGVIHCFTGTKEFAEEVLKLGFYISISGIVTFKNAVALQNLVRDLPMDRILVETDAPYLAPAPYRGKRNEPAYVKSTAEFIANLKNVNFELIESKTTENFYNLFSKVKVILNANKA